jgi:hypothetical protein
MHSVFVAIIILMAVLIHFYTHDNTIAEHDTVKTSKFLRRFILIERHSELSLVNVDLVLHVLEELILVTLVLLSSGIIRVARHAILVTVANIRSHGTFAIVSGAYLANDIYHVIGLAFHTTNPVFFSRQIIYRVISTRTSLVCDVDHVIGLALRTTHAFLFSGHIKTRTISTRALFVHDVDHIIGLALRTVYRSSFSRHIE